MAPKYDPLKHHRRSIRLKGWNYSAPGAYFVTICTHQREILFANQQFREIAEYLWRMIPTRPHARRAILDEWVVMPNHLHGLILLEDLVGEKISSPPEKGPMAGSLPTIIGNYKSLVTRRINNVRRTRGGKVWQRGYFERIVRNETELNAVRKYIQANPERWDQDRENLDGLISKMHKIKS